MILELILVTIVFWRHKDEAGSDFQLIASAWGILINILCLLLLLLAEWERCCPSPVYPSPSRNLAATYDYPIEVKSESETDTDCCTAFGTRTYGGIGRIEPFTCLIALSTSRFIFAGCVMKYFSKKPIEDIHRHVNSDENHDHHGPDPVTKVRDLWLTAIGMHR